MSRAHSLSISLDAGRGIDPLLADGDRAFAELPRTANAVVGALRALLDEHLALEEAEIVPFLRVATALPPPPTDVRAFGALRPGAATTPIPDIQFRG